MVATRPARDLISYIKLVFNEVNTNSKSLPEIQGRINNQYNVRIVANKQQICCGVDVMVYYKTRV